MNIEYSWHSKSDLIRMATEMNSASANFYRRAIKIGNHAFIEFCGLMQEYIKMCEQTADKEEDYTQANIHSGESLQAFDYNIKYFAGKFECIFGPTLKVKEHRETFMKELGWDIANPFEGLECHEPVIEWSDENQKWMVYANKLPEKFLCHDETFHGAITKFKEKLRDG